MLLVHLGELLLHLLAGWTLGLRVDPGFYLLALLPTVVHSQLLDMVGGTGLEPATLAV